MSLLNKLTIKNLKLNKKRTIVTIIGIILSVALVTAVASMYSSLVSSLIKYETTEKGNFHVAFYDVDTTDLNLFKNNREIEKFYITENIGYALINSQNESKPYVFIKAFNNDAIENLAVNLVEGRLPENDGEIVIPTHLKTNGRVELKVGDKLTIDVGTRVDSTGKVLSQLNSFDSNNKETLVNTQSVTYTIVGIINRPANSVEPYSAPGYTFITKLNSNNLTPKVDVFVRYTKKGLKNEKALTAGILEVDPDCYEMSITGKINSEVSAKRVTEEMTHKKYDFNTNKYLIDLETNPFQNESISSLGGVIVVVCLIIVFTSIFCIKNSFDISITEKIKQYGMLKSIGATKKQIKHNVFFEATILGAIGIPLGLLSGIFASYILIIVSNIFLKKAMAENLVLIFSLNIYCLIIAIVLGIITLYFSAFRSAHRASKISPIESIRNSANLKLNNKKLKTNKLIHTIFGIGGDISIKNLKRNKRKYRTTVISIIVSTTVFIALYSFMSLAFDSVKLELGNYNYDIVLQIKETQENMAKVKEATNLDNITNYSIQKNIGLYLDNPILSKEYKEVFPNDEDEAFIQIFVISDNEYLNYLKELGLDYNAVKDKGILIDNVFTNYYNAKKDKVENIFIPYYEYKEHDIISGTINDKTNLVIEIAKVTEKLPFPYNLLYSPTLIISDELYYTKINPNFDNNSYATVFYKSNNATKLQDDIEKTLNGLDYNLNNIEEQATIMNNLFILIGIFLYGFIIVISLIGVTNIFNTITTNMELRKQEFAMLKSIGMTNKEFKKMIRLESIFMGIKSLIIGIPLGIILSYLIYYLFNSPNEYKLPIIAIVITIIAVYLLITLIMHYSLKKINKQNTIETIRNENI